MQGDCDQTGKDNICRTCGNLRRTRDVIKYGGIYILQFKGKEEP